MITSFMKKSIECKDNLSSARNSKTYGLTMEILFLNITQEQDLLIPISPDKAKEIFLD